MDEPTPPTKRPVLTPATGNLLSQLRNYGKTTREELQLSLLHSVTAAYQQTRFCQEGFFSVNVSISLDLPASHSSQSEAEQNKRSNNGIYQSFLVPRYLEYTQGRTPWVFLVLFIISILTKVFIAENNNFQEKTSASQVQESPSRKAATDDGPSSIATVSCQFGFDG